MTYTLRATSQYQNQKDKSSFSVYGQSLLDYGLCVTDGISGVGLITRGLVWEGYEIWLFTQDVAPVTTGWTAAIGWSGGASLITTSWSGASTPTTAWTLSDSGMNGEFPA